MDLAAMFMAEKVVDKSNDMLDFVCCISQHHISRSILTTCIEITSQEYGSVSIFLGVQHDVLLHLDKCGEPLTILASCGEVHSSVD